MLSIYCISGLGADQRVFQKLNIPGAELIEVPWQTISAQDDLKSYARKLAESIPESPKCIILGLSFGGMLASEIARFRPNQKVILISSAKSSEELTPIHSVSKYLGIKGFIPFFLTPFFTARLLQKFGTKDFEEEKIIRAIMKDADRHFLKNAIRLILSWKTVDAPPLGILQIHGTADKILLPQFVNPTHWIEGGEHLMIYSRASEINSIIFQYIS